MDSDHDGLPDSLEDALLQRFAPRLEVSADDCSDLPARFSPGISIPTVTQEDGTRYGQATPRKVHGRDAIELHFYHLWRRDCGRLGHPLDAEHVSVLLRLEPGRNPVEAANWQAEFWYAAAHEDTVCDASQIARASTLKAATHGADIWISSGKHASFLTETLCSRGCGGDRCERLTTAPMPPVVNLGEWRYPMNGALWMASDRWPLSDKITRSDFLDTRIDRLLRLPESDVAWANPEKRPMQGAILGGSHTVDGTLTGVRSTDTAISVAADKTGGALEKTSHSTKNAVGSAASHTGHALGASIHAAGKTLHLRRNKSGEKAVK